MNCVMSQRRSNVISFQNVEPRFKLPTAHLSDDASFEPFNFVLTDSSEEATQQE